MQVPVVVSTTVGNGPSRFELGIGVVPGILTTEDAPQPVEVPVTLVVGYRYCPPDGGFLFRAGATPLFDFWDPSFKGLPAVPLVGVSFGYAF